MLRIRDALKYQAGVAGATFVDPIAAGWFVGRPDLIGKDGVHPTDAGHAYMADKIAPLIRAQLSRLIGTQSKAKHDAPQAMSACGASVGC